MKFQITHPVVVEAVVRNANRQAFNVVTDCEIEELSAADCETAFELLRRQGAVDTVLRRGDAFLSSWSWDTLGNSFSTFPGRVIVSQMLFSKWLPYRNPADEFRSAVKASAKSHVLSPATKFINRQPDNGQVDGYSNHLAVKKASTFGPAAEVAVEQARDAMRRFVENYVSIDGVMHVRRHEPCILAHADGDVVLSDFRYLTRWVDGLETDKYGLGVSVPIETPGCQIFTIAQAEEALDFAAPNRAAQGLHRMAGPSVLACASFAPQTSSDEMESLELARLAKNAVLVSRLFGWAAKAKATDDPRIEALGEAAAVLRMSVIDYESRTGRSEAIRSALLAAETLLEECRPLMDKHGNPEAEAAKLLVNMESFRRRADTAPISISNFRM
jgi:hypothetical protein